jgi:hypothetical protein
MMIPHLNPASSTGVWCAGPGAVLAGGQQVCLETVPTPTPFSFSVNVQMESEIAEREWPLGLFPSPGQRTLDGNHAHCRGRGQGGGKVPMSGASPEMRRNHRLPHMAVDSRVVRD